MTKLVINEVVAKAVISCLAISVLLHNRATNCKGAIAPVNVGGVGPLLLCVERAE